MTDDGVIYLSFKYGKGERIDNERFFCDMDELRWKTIVAKIPHVIEYHIWLSADKRSGIKNNRFNITIKKTD